MKNENILHGFIKGTKGMKVLIESSKIIIGTNAVFCQRTVRLSIRSAPISPKKQRHPPQGMNTIRGCTD